MVEGPTLADRIAKGPIPLDEALPIAKQIAEALEAAHEAGVIHRDLKPANIKVREDGTVKVLDFGLAKALDTAPAGDPDQSPTLTAAATQMGVILGTAAYMSPEQARGRTADRQSDLWSLGVVLFEMLTGRPLFLGEDPSTTLSNVQQRAPDWNLLPADLPAGVGRFLKRCLVRDPKARLQGAGDLRLALDEAFEVPAPEDGSDHGSLVTVGRTAAVFLLGSLVALAAVWWLGRVPSIQRERFFRDAFADYTSGRWASAIQGFDDYISRFPDSDLADDAQFYIGQTYYADGQYRQATEAFEQVELSYAAGDRVAEALYKRGVTLERLGEPEQARRAYELVVQDYPANNVAADLAQRALDRTSQGQRPR